MYHKLSLLIVLLISSVIHSFAQIEQISIGPAYSQQTFYSIENGASTSIANEAWDIAFTNQGETDAGIILNESAGFGSEALALFVSQTTDWDSVNTDVSVYADSLRLYNGYDNWSEGAFNVVKDSEDPFDYGWGSYDPSTHQISGSKIFVIRKRDGAFLKMHVSSLNSGTYTFRYANLDGSDEQEYSISKMEDNARFILPYSFETHSEIDIPAGFDMIFMRYFIGLDDGEGNILQYGVTGILTAPNVMVAVAQDVDPESVSESDYSDSYTDDITAIGHDWKFFDFSLGWVVDLERTFFVQDIKGDKYQMTFYDFEGSSTGTATFEKRAIVSSSTLQAVAPSVENNVFPNPFTDQLSVTTSTIELTTLKFYNNVGQVLHTEEFAGQTTLQLSDIQSGVYILELTQGDSKSLRKVIK